MKIKYCVYNRNRLKPRQTGRQLEQQRQQLSFSQPQQQRPVEPQQQQRLPVSEDIKRMYPNIDLEFFVTVR